MKGIVLTGGTGTRLNPVTKAVNKHALLVWNLPMFFYPLHTIFSSGIKDIAVISGPPHGNQIRMLMNHIPAKWDVRLTYVEQPTPAGMSDAILRCRKFTQNQSIMVCAGDNYYENDFKSEVSAFATGAMSFLRKTSEFNRFAIPKYDSRGKLISIEEKAQKANSNLVVTGPHFYDNRVFDMIDKIRPSTRGELEITDLNNEYLKIGQLILLKKNDYWSDMGTFDSLLKTSEHIRRKNL
ncbi:MAG: Glucose-1-phosphate thymidylyltransferase [Candidatus Amesbacteria bacterium GW2011_GWB1_47_19]|nr:MAG: Glucose-1-phosphate thymidylyltransferase [Candidatus Amesbacteria bacterium GW2011_GWA1_44_24]KKU31705.1 MAG: Glucose-1-phosphate thymidylyltransferase [Candidatus Amesbacteria bacterium GW2011_GWC1_46_24]KKU67618.1 MAG: Glucose-1-phosphate thymidylyltransferase [Candidatus Amesbacteria bacterium GW2011_GWB1_47_19]OGD06468.1 MAG: hypothetical protein A2379_02400 [Candidatus Amesbacteria bacterium RIFOXYB1_FULL_47_13]HBC72872.1 spore coat protein [Candidatus Amesbacteria bacterium]